MAAAPAMIARIVSITRNGTSLRGPRIQRARSTLKLGQRADLVALRPFWRVAGGVWRKACGVWRLASGVWRMRRQAGNVTAFPTLSQTR